MSAPELRERASGTQPTPARAETLFEIQALRALAVLLVVVYHVWPNRLPGGFIGVDVFFVISGFLITAHLMRDYDRSGKLSLTQFWARRIRRLLPAAFLVLAVCVVFLFTVLPEVVLENSLKQVAAASAYVLNWVLAFDSVDYLAAGNDASIVQHYWTLSVEEQFYIGWPILLVIVAFVVARVRRSRASSVSLFGWSAVAVVFVSLAYSIYLTWYSPSLAYFAATTRAWEFAAGALVAVGFAAWPSQLRRIRQSALVRRTSLPTLAGGVMIVASAFVLSGASPFPGWIAAVPVVGTALIIIGGMPTAPGLGPVIRFRPVQFVGDVSYSLYLWHWPLIIVFLLLMGDAPSTVQGLGIIVVSVALAAATKYFVEDPSRRARFFTRRRLPAYALAVSGALVFIAISGVTSYSLAAQRDAALQEVIDKTEKPTGCFGANATLGTSDCPDPFTLGPDVNLALAAADLDTDHWCLTWYDQDWASCEFGDLTGKNGTYALVGDSHAAAMTAALAQYFERSGIKLVTFTRFGCSGLTFDSSRLDLSTSDGQTNQACIDWSKRVNAELIDRDDIDKVIYTNFSSSYLTPDRAMQLDPAEIASLWQGVIDSGKQVVALTDAPHSIGTDVPTCLSSHVGESGPCSVPRSEGIPVDAVDRAVTLMNGEVQLVDSRDAFCDDERCYAVVGGVVVYADSNHISGTFSRTLMPFIGPQLLERR